MTQLTRITKLHYRIFQNFQWPKNLHSFGKFNVIYGWNGSGKTTLSSLFALIEYGKSLTDGEVELEFDGERKVSGNAFSSVSSPKVRVFNRDFINAALQSTGGISPIYFIGEDSADKQKKISDLKKELAFAANEVTSAIAAKAKSESELDAFFVAQAKIIKGVLIGSVDSSYNNYDKRRFKQSVTALDADRASAAVLDDTKMALARRTKDAQPKPVIDRIVAPQLDLAALTVGTEDLVMRSIIAETLDELTANPTLAGWVQRGLELHTGVHFSDVCRFCEEPISAKRRGALERHFNDALSGFQRELEAHLLKVRAAKQIVDTISLPSVSQFYEALVPELEVIYERIRVTRTETRAALDALMNRIEVKRGNPFEVAPLESPSITVCFSMMEAVHELNSVIRRHNDMSNQFKESVRGACEKLEASYVAVAYLEFVGLSTAVAARGAELDAVQSEPAKIQREINELERTILEHRRPADELTAELSAYLGRDELRFEVRGNGYALTRDGKTVSNLSEGERTAITFLYFLKSLQDSSFDIEHGIVVIDDPVSSLDANAMFSAFGYMQDRTKNCGQLFILTHNFQFFRNVKNWFRHLPGQNKKNVDARLGRLFLLRSFLNSDNIRMSQIGPMDTLLENHESEYQYLFKVIHEEAHRDSAASWGRYYGTPNVARRLVEAFLTFRFPEMSGDLGKRLDRVVDDYNYERAKKIRIHRFLNTYSHAEHLSDSDTDPSNLAETPVVLREVLEMMKAVDPDHYRGLESVVSRETFE